MTSSKRQHKKVGQGRKSSTIKKVTITPNQAVELQQLITNKMRAMELEQAYVRAVFAGHRIVPTGAYRLMRKGSKFYIEFEVNS